MKSQHEKKTTYRSLYQERQYGGYWYSALWRVLRPILVGLAVTVIVIGLGMSLWNRLYQEFAGPVDAQDQSEILFTIESGQSLTRVAGNLEAAGLIHNRSVFKYYCDLPAWGRSCRSGNTV